MEEIKTGREIIQGTWGRQNNGNIKKLKNRICLCAGYIERTSVGNSQ
jgi:hypothetical protein